MNTQKKTERKVKDEMIQMSTAKKHNVRKCQIRGKVKDPVEY